MSFTKDYKKKTQVVKNEKQGMNEANKNSKFFNKSTEVKQMSSEVSDKEKTFSNNFKFKNNRTSNKQDFNDNKNYKKSKYVTVFNKEDEEKKARNIQAVTDMANLAIAMINVNESLELDKYPTLPGETIQQKINRVNNLKKKPRIISNKNSSFFNLNPSFFRASNITFLNTLFSELDKKYKNFYSLKTNRSYFLFNNLRSKKIFNKHNYIKKINLLNFLLSLNDNKIFQIKKILNRRLFVNNLNYFYIKEIINNPIFNLFRNIFKNNYFKFINYNYKFKIINKYFSIINSFKVKNLLNKLSKFNNNVNLNSFFIFRFLPVSLYFNNKIKNNLVSYYLRKYYLNNDIVNYFSIHLKNQELFLKQITKISSIRKEKRFNIFKEISGNQLIDFYGFSFNNTFHRLLKVNENEEKSMLQELEEEERLSEPMKREKYIKDINNIYNKLDKKKQLEKEGKLEQLFYTTSEKVLNQINQKYNIIKKLNRKNKIILLKYFLNYSKKVDNKLENLEQKEFLTDHVKFLERLNNLRLRLNSNSQINLKISDLVFYNLETYFNDEDKDFLFRLKKKSRFILLNLFKYENNMYDYEDLLRNYLDSFLKEDFKKSFRITRIRKKIIPLKYKNYVFYRNKNIYYKRKLFGLTFKLKLNLKKKVRNKINNILLNKFKLIYQSRLRHKALIYINLIKIKKNKSNRKETLKEIHIRQLKENLKRSLRKEGQKISMNFFFSKFKRKKKESYDFNKQYFYFFNKKINILEKKVSNFNISYLNSLINNINLSEFSLLKNNLTSNKDFILDESSLLNKKKSNYKKKKKNISDKVKSEDLKKNKEKESSDSNQIEVKKKKVSLIKNKKLKIKDHLNFYDLLKEINTRLSFVNFFSSKFKRYSLKKKKIKNTSVHKNLVLNCKFIRLFLSQYVNITKNKLHKEKRKFKDKEKEKIIHERINKINDKFNKKINKFNSLRLKISSNIINTNYIDYISNSINTLNKYNSKLNFIANKFRIKNVFINVVSYVPVTFSPKLISNNTNNYIYIYWNLNSLYFRFLGFLIKDGKRGKAENIFNNSLSFIKEFIVSNPIFFFFQSVYNSQPLFEYIKHKKRFKTFIFPRITPHSKRLNISMRNIAKNIRSSKYNIKKSNKVNSSYLLYNLFVSYFFLKGKIKKDLKENLENAFQKRHFFKKGLRKNSFKYNKLLKFMSFRKMRGYHF